jgi:hypothetical protein
VYDIERLVYRCVCRAGLTGDGNTCSPIGKYKQIIAISLHYYYLPYYNTISLPKFVSITLVYGYFQDYECQLKILCTGIDRVQGAAGAGCGCCSGDTKTPFIQQGLHSLI